MKHHLLYPLIAFVAIATIATGCSCTRVEGDECMLKQTMTSGLLNEVYGSGTYFYVSVFTQKQRLI